MSTRIAIAMVIAFALLMSLDPGIASASPAKGIVKSGAGGSGGMGSIVVTEGETVRFPPTDDPTAPASVTINAGDTISFAGDPTATEGDLVEFAIGVDPTDGSIVATDLAIVGDGTFITGDHDGNVMIGAGEGAVISGANVSGNVTVDGGVLVVTGASVVGGNLKADDDAFILID